MIYYVFQFRQNIISLTEMENFGTRLFRGHRAATHCRAAAGVTVVNGDPASVSVAPTGMPHIAMPGPYFLGFDFFFSQYT